MWKSILSRLVGSLTALFVLSILSFTFVRLLPGNISSAVLGFDASEAARRAVIEEYGLDKPLPIQYLTWATGIAHGNFGYTAIGHQPVLPTVLNAASISAAIAAGGILIALCVSLPLGIVAGLRRGSVTDRVATGLAVVTTSVPDFVVGLGLIILIALNLPTIFPIFGYAPLSDGVWAWGRHLILPALAVSTLMIGLFTRLIRSAVAETLEAEFVRTAYGKGLRRSRIMIRHIIRPSLIPVITAAGLYIVTSIASVAVVEQVFAIPGLGRLVIESVSNRDDAVVQGAILVVGSWAVLVSFILDVCYIFLDPRVRNI